MGIFTTYQKVKIRIISVSGIMRHEVKIKVTKTTFDGGFEIDSPKEEEILLHVGEDKVL